MGPSDRHDRLRRWQAASLLAAAPIASLSATDAAASAPQAPPGQQRIAPAALVERLHQRVLSGQSATATLEHWCAEHGLAAQAGTRGARGQDKPAPADVLQALGATRPGTPLRYRRVQLVCGSRVLSEADNWYLPEHLSPAMNQVLDSTDEPFGRVVGPLGFQRQTLADQTFCRARRRPRRDPGGARPAARPPAAALQLRHRVVPAAGTALGHRRAPSQRISTAEGPALPGLLFASRISGTGSPAAASTGARTGRSCRPGRTASRLRSCPPAGGCHAGC